MARPVGQGSWLAGWGGVAWGQIVAEVLEIQECEGGSTPSSDMWAGALTLKRVGPLNPKEMP